ncbi:hypothetical protein PSEUBRA_003070 [Kalmanozyma brasiliensis GHG001]|uniref:uncharacterized protein n=1 Tax=Kalmanozyma brasiliensis (strain GHG001) TaxID=1365824 RepID=UPI002867DB94|nr:uncharacterized protein PSEUBRA_003070 [Kalmanozyma brasiliensis GHG001]KAF6767177.1 hypothetical protein PSEUBRA_003070 [Kalmanozyma brasiliensis GHG001]
MATRATMRTLFLLTLALLLTLAQGQSISQPQPTLPVQSYSDDPVVLSTLLCSLNTDGGHGIGPLTPQSACMSMTLQPHATSSVNAQTLPPSGIVTIFEPSSTASVSSASSTTTTSAASATSASTTTNAGAASATTEAPRQTNAGQNNSPPAVAVAIAKYNIGLLLFTGFALLAGVTYFLDELLGYLL